MSESNSRKARKASVESMISILESHYLSHTLSVNLQQFLSEPRLLMGVITDGSLYLPTSYDVLYGTGNLATPEVLQQTMQATLAFRKWLHAVLWQSGGVECMWITVHCKLSSSLYGHLKNTQRSNY